MYPAEDFYFEKRFGLDLALILAPSVEDYLELTLLRVKGARRLEFQQLVFLWRTH